MVLGHDDDLAQDTTRTSNRLRGLLTSTHPALERVLGSRLRHPAVLALLQTFGSPAPGPGRHRADRAGHAPGGAAHAQCPHSG